MAVRVLAGAAAGWLCLYLLLYLRVVAGQGGEVAPWYVVVVVLAVLVCFAAALCVAGVGTTATALVLTAAAAFAGLFTIGLLLVPAVVALAIALSYVQGAGPGRRGDSTRPRRHTGGLSEFVGEHWAAAGNRGAEQ